MYDMDDFNLPAAALYVIFACIPYFITLVVYRIYYSPLARFPGSKLAAATGWVEAYYDIVKGGQLTFQIQKWHERYGVYQSSE